MLTLLEIVKRTSEYFARHGIDSPRLNAELVIAHALGMNRMKIYLQFERPLNQRELEQIRPLVRRRAQREPLAYVLGTAAFGDLLLHSDRRALVPRPETEQLAEIAGDALGDITAPRILDLGTGTGALALALAHAHPQAQVVAVDSSSEALDLARTNAATHHLDARVHFRLSHWFSALSAEERFDLIVSNPPYLTEEEWATAQPEVREHEPKSALVAGDGGCADLLSIIAGAPRHLTPGACLFLETGIDQHPRLLAALSEVGLQEARSLQDWSERPRFVTARAAP